MSGLFQNECEVVLLKTAVSRNVVPYTAVSRDVVPYTAVSRNVVPYTAVSRDVVPYTFEVGCVQQSCEG